MSTLSIDEKRGRIPTWTTLRSIGNSRAVQLSVVFPVIGYLILLNSEVTNLFDGGLAGPGHDGGFWERLWNSKLYFVYFGLVSLGIGSAIYQLRCPHIVRKHADWADYVRIDGSAMGDAMVFVLSKILERDIDHDTVQGKRPLDQVKADYMRRHFAESSAERKTARFFVSIFFLAGFGLLSVPSCIAATKIFALLWQRL